MFSILVFAHFASDFVFQTNKMIELKKNDLLKGLIYHGLVVGLITLISVGFATYGIYRNVDILYILSITLAATIAHVVIDFAKQLVSKHIKTVKQEMYLFLGDQLVHVLVLLVIAITYSSYLSFYLGKLLTMFIISTVVVSYLIDYILALFGLDKGDENQIQIGRYIGILERFLYLVALLTQQYLAFGVIVAFKGALRINKDNDSSDYFILGNLLSICFVVLIYIFFTIF
jgi:hypothetical protein